MVYCATCLSSDRSLRFMRDLRKVISVIKLLNLGLDISRDYVCWECEARFHNIYSFRKQVYEAQKRIMVMQKTQKFNNKPYNTIDSLSRLSIVKNNSYDQHYLNVIENIDDNEESVKDKHIKKENEVGNVMENECKEGIIEVPLLIPTRSEEIKLDDVEIDFIEDWDGLENFEDTNKDVDEDSDFALLIVDNDEEYTKDNENNSDEDSVEEKPLKLSKEEENFTVTQMTMDELNVCRNMDRDAAVYKRCQYKCLMCITGYYQESKFERHLNLKHDLIFDGKRRRFKCSICESRFLMKHALQTHYEKHFRKYTCKLCEFSHHKLATMFMHNIREHEKGSSHTCRICKVTFDRRHALDWHYKTHKEKPECNVCGKAFSCRTNLKTHMAIHEAPNNVQCPDCGRWVRETNLAVHRRTHEVVCDESAYCAECNQQFTSLSLYKRHVARSSRHRKP